MAALSMQLQQSAAHAQQVSQLSSLFPTLSPATHATMASVNLAFHAGAMNFGQLALPAVTAATGAIARNPATRRTAVNMAGRALTQVAGSMIKNMVEESPEEKAQKEQEAQKQAEQARDKAREATADANREQFLHGNKKPNVGIL